METEKTFGLSNNQKDILQENADCIRLLKIGLRNHDPEVVNAAMIKMTNSYGEEVADKTLLESISILMNQEDWSFELEEGEASPLL